MILIKKLDKFHTRILEYSNFIGSFWIFILMMAIVFDVFGRVFFGLPLKGTPEIVSNSIIAITFLQIPYVMLTKQHVRSTLIYDKLKPKYKDIIDITVSLIGIFLFALLVKASWALFISAVQIKEFEGEGALRVPTSPVRFILVIGSIMMIVEYIFTILRKVFNYKINLKDRKGDIE